MKLLFTRAGVIAAVAATLVLGFAAPASAARNAEAEAYVQANAAEALEVLRANARVTEASRRQQFYRLMEQLADMPRISTYVLGRYGVQLRADAALRAEWQQTFQDYAIAVYENQLARYAQSDLRVTGSIERRAGVDVVVLSEMIPPSGGRALPVQWRLLKSGASWKVVDVALVVEGNEIWLAQQQQRDFLAELDSNNGDIRALMRSVRDQTERMQS